jgi:hypothetical protein
MFAANELKCCRDIRSEFRREIRSPYHIKLLNAKEFTFLFIIFLQILRRILGAVNSILEARDSLVFMALCYKLEGRGFETR